MSAGKPQKQSIAVALDVQRRAKGKKMASGGEVTSAKSESRPMPESITHQEMQMIMDHRASKPVSSWDEHKPTIDDQEDIMMADGGEVAGWADGRDTIDSEIDQYDKHDRSEQSISREPVEGWTDEEDTADHEDHPMSVAESIMKRKGYAAGGEVDGNKKSFYSGMMSKKKFASGGEVDDLEPFEIEGHEKPEDGEADVARNAREDQNHEDDQSFKALRKENYSEQSGLDDLDQPEDSNETGDSRERSEEDEHDMIGKIRKGMKMRKVGQRYSQE